MKADRGIYDCVYRSQQHGRRGQGIDTRKAESGMVLTCQMDNGEN